MGELSWIERVAIPATHPTSATPDRVDRRTGPQVTEPAYILGFAGLLPQIAAVASLALGVDDDLGHGFAFGYAGLIFSFVGGAWWGLVVRRAGRQGAMLIAAVAPSVIVAMLMLALVGHAVSLRLALLVLGVGLIAMLRVDAMLQESGDAPVGWMTLRMPLSLGLGALTLAAAAIG